MSAHHPYGPSKIGTMKPGRCQGRAREEQSYPELDLGLGAAGSIMHDWIAKCLTGKATPRDIKNSETRELVERSIAWLATRLPGLSIIGVERPVKIYDTVGNLLTAGTSDVVGELKGLHIVDWKGYHEPLDDETARLQVATYAVGEMQALGVSRADGWLYLPVLDLEYHASVELATALPEVEHIIREAEKPDSPLVPGPWCKYCSAQVGCPAIAENAAKLAVVFNGKNGSDETREVLKERYKGQVEEMARLKQFDRIAKLLELGYTTQPAIEATRTVAKELMGKGYAEHVPRWQLKDKPHRKSADVLAVIDKVSDVLSREEIAKCLTLSWSELESQWCSRLQMEADARGASIDRRTSLRKLHTLLGTLSQTVTRTELWRKKT